MGREAGFVPKYRKTKPWVHPKTGQVRMVILMDDETYAEVDAYARKHNCTVSRAAATMIDVGIETFAIEDMETRP